MIGFIERVVLAFLHVLGTGFSGASSLQDGHLRIFQGTSRIVEKIEDAPFTVYIRLVDVNDKKKLECTGSIITKDWVLSAGHCLPDSEIARVYAGCSSRGDFKKQAQAREVIEAKAHPEYNPPIASPKLVDFTYDIGLMKVNRSFILGPKVNTISLWAKKWEGVQQDKFKYSSIECTAYGWGMAANLPANNLRAGEFTVRRGEQACTCIPGLTERVSLCTAELSNKSVCTGDDGGPAVCNGLLAGIESGGFTCPDYDGEEPIDCGGKNVISRWVYVCPMLGWIRRNVPEAPEPPASCRSSHQIQTPLWALVSSFYFII